MKNFVQNGMILSLVAAAAVNAGDGLLVGKIFGVAVANVAAGASGEFQTVGVFQLPALATDVAAQGAILYWDAANKRLTVTAAGNTRVGVAAVAKANGDATATIKLDSVIA
jgi:predicted RecA/RadA family phage recombinase